MFKSDFRSVAQFSQVVGKACVLFIRDYLKFLPEVQCMYVNCHTWCVHAQLEDRASPQGLKAWHLSDSVDTLAFCTGFLSRLEVPEQALDGIALDLGLV